MRWSHIAGIAAQPDSYLVEEWPFIPGTVFFASTNRIAATKRGFHTTCKQLNEARSARQSTMALPQSLIYILPYLTRRSLHRPGSLPWPMPCSPAMLLRPLPDKPLGERCRTDPVPYLSLLGQKAGERPSARTPATTARERVVNAPPSFIGSICHPARLSRGPLAGAVPVSVRLRQDFPVCEPRQGHVVSHPTMLCQKPRKGRFAKPSDSLPQRKVDTDPRFTGGLADWTGRAARPRASRLVVRIGPDEDLLNRQWRTV